MCEVVAKGRRTFREQDPPRIREGKRRNGEEEKQQHLLESSSSTSTSSSSSSSSSSSASSSRSTPSSPTVQQRGLALEKCLSEPRFLEHERSSNTGKDQFLRELSLKVPSCSRHDDQVIINGLSRDTDSCEGQPNGRKMAPVLGVPPPPPPAPHMGPDGLILPRKPYNPCLTSGNHKDLRRELLFNQKIGRNVLNQKSELQRALEKQREAASRREAEKSREETYKDDPRTALQRAIEQRAKHIQMTLDQSQPTTEPPSNLLITARAKLRPRTDSQ